MTASPVENLDQRGRCALVALCGRWPVKRSPSRPAKRAEALNALCLSLVAGRNSTPILCPSLKKMPPTCASFALCANSVQPLKTSEAASNSPRTWAETKTAPRISPRGRRLTSTRRPLVNGDLQLRVRRSLRTLSVNASGTDSDVRTDPRWRSHCDCENLRRERWDRFADSLCPILSRSPRDRVPLGHVERRRAVPTPAGL